METWHYWKFLLASYSTDYVDCTRQDSRNIKQALLLSCKCWPSDINLHTRLPVVIYWCDSTDGILHFVFVTSVALYLNVPLQNIPSCFHYDWNSARIGSTRNQQQQWCYRPLAVKNKLRMDAGCSKIHASDYLKKTPFFENWAMTAQCRPPTKRSPSLARVAWYL